MDFIERIFGISPDHGSGSLEFALLLVPVLVVMAIVGVVRQRGLAGRARVVRPRADRRWPPGYWPS